MLEYLYTQTPLVWFIQSYWRDEAFSVLLAQRSWFDIIRLTAQDFSPPLYYLLLKIWMVLIGTSEVATRSLSLVFYVLTVFVMVEFLVHVLHYRVRKAAVLGIAAGLFTPLLVYYAFETRGYALLAFLSMLSIYALCTHKWKMYVIAMVAGLLSHYLMCFMLVIHMFIYYRGLVGHHPKLPAVRLFILPILGIGLWVLFSVFQKQRLIPSVFWIPHPTLFSLLTSPALLLTGFDLGWGFAYDLIPLSIITTLVIGIPLLRDHHTTKISRILFLNSFGLVLLVYVVSSVSSNSLFISRYLILASAPLVLLLIIQLHKFKGIFQIIFAFSLLVSLWHYQSINISKRHKENLDQRLETLKQTAKSTDYLFVTSVLDYHTAQVYWFDQDKVKIIGTKYEDIPQYVGKVLIPRSAIVSTNPCVSSCTVYILDQSRQIHTWIKQ